MSTPPVKDVTDRREAILVRVRGIAAATFGCSGDAIARETTAGDVNGWDSLSHTHFLIAVEREFSIRFDLKRVVRLSNVGDLVDEVASLAP